MQDISNHYPAAGELNPLGCNTGSDKDESRFYKF
jgi:hypothetical protein